MFYRMLEKNKITKNKISIINNKLLIHVLFYVI